MEKGMVILIDASCHGLLDELMKTKVKLYKPLIEAWLKEDYMISIIHFDTKVLQETKFYTTLYSVKTNFPFNFPSRDGVMLEEAVIRAGEKLKHFRNKNIVVLTDGIIPDIERSKKRAKEYGANLFFLPEYIDIKTLKKMNVKII